MKKIHHLLFIVVFMMILIYVVIFAYNNFRGIGPTVVPPAKDITKEINTTGFPLKLPDGFSISIFAKDLNNPRVLAWDPYGSLFVSIPSQEKVVALPDKNDDGEADMVIEVITGLNKPHGIAFHPISKKLYIAETDQVSIYDYDELSLKATNKKKIIDLPGGGNHFSRTIGFGPDGRLYISIGSSCNVCIENDWRRAKILVANADGSDLKEYASGLRNSVFFTWHPVTRELWATDMGRDLIGDDIPPDEINIIKERDPSTSSGQGFYGWPYCYGKKIRDETVQLTGRDPVNSTLVGTDICDRSIGSHIELPAHSAPLGLAFISNINEPKGLNNSPTGNTIRPFESWPKEYRNNLLVAYHGSWNRSIPTGYKVVRMKLDAKGKYEGVEDFITGWFPPDGGPAGALGRPVDLLFGSDGALYISDDKAGVIYSVTYQGSK